MRNLFATLSGRKHLVFQIGLPGAYPRALPNLNTEFLRIAVLGLFIASSSPTQANLEKCQLALVESPADALPVCELALANELPASDRNAVTRVQIDMASNAIVHGNFAAAERLLDDALLENTTLLENNFYRFNWLRIKALIYFKQDKYSAAIPYMRDALTVALVLDNPRSIATSHNDLGASYLELGDYANALSNFQRALQYLRRVGNEYSTALTLANIASVYRDSGDFPAAVEYLEKALDSHFAHLEAFPNDFYAVRALAQVREDLGITLTDLGRLIEARAALAEAYFTYEENELFLDQIRVLSANADLELEEGNPGAAMSMLEQALSLEEKTPPKKSIEVRRGLVDTHIALAETEAAQRTAQEGLELARASGQLPDELFFLERLIDIAAALEQHPASRHYQSLYFDKYRASLEQRYESQMAELESSLQLEQQQHDIAALEAEGRALRRSIALQRWLIVGAAVIVLLLLGIVLLVWRQRSNKRAWLNREIALHRQDFDGDPNASEESDPGDDSAIELVEESREDQSDFNTAIVRLMCSCVEIWEQGTGQSRIELAEKSRVWQVTIDNGRLRTRTMDRYCDLKKLPKVPRWRQVVRTCRYILIHCELSDLQRRRLNDELEQLFEIQRLKALSA